MVFYASLSLIQASPVRVWVYLRSISIMLHNVIELLRLGPKHSLKKKTKQDEIKQNYWYLSDFNMQTELSHYRWHRETGLISRLIII